jgi:hypothetical protein
MTFTNYKKAIAKLLKSYHKKWDWQGKPKKSTRKKVMDAFTQVVIILIIVIIIMIVFNNYK